MQQSVGGGDWPHPILGVLQPDEKIGILRFENSYSPYGEKGRKYHEAILSI